MGGECRQRFYVLAARSKAVRLSIGRFAYFCCERVSLFTFAVFYGYFLEKTYLRRIILAVASIPIAISANAVRIFGTGMCVQYWDAEKALGFFHQFSGWVMFLISLGCLSVVHYFMLLFPIHRRSVS